MNISPNNEINPEYSLKVLIQYTNFFYSFFIPFPHEGHWFLTRAFQIFFEEVYIPLLLPLVYHQLPSNIDKHDLSLIFCNKNTNTKWTVEKNKCREHLVFYFKN